MTALLALDLPKQYSDGHKQQIVIWDAAVVFF